MAVFDKGVLRVEQQESGPVLHYRLASRALLFCLLAPLLFLMFAQLTVLVSQAEQASKQAAAEKSEKVDKKDVVLPQHPIDKALGSPAPEKPKKKDETLKPTASYVFAVLFALLYAVGRVLEARLIRSLFAKTLAAE